jgi:threonyl-tRNA synthetase
LGQLKDAGIRAQVDKSPDTLGKKIREAKTQKVPYLLVIGDQEVADGTATLEGREGNSPAGERRALPIADIVSRVSLEIKNRA